MWPISETKPGTSTRWQDATPLTCPQENQVVASGETWLEDLLQRGQVQSPDGKVERGGVKQAICHPRWQWSHNNMVAAPFFSPQTKHGRPSGTTANSGCTEPSMGKWQGVQFLECSQHSRPSLPSSKRMPLGNTSFTRRMVRPALTSNVVGASRCR